MWWLIRVKVGKTLIGGSGGCDRDRLREVVSDKGVKFQQLWMSYEVSHHIENIIEPFENQLFH